MEQMQEIFFSGTFGGELLSLSAAETVLKLHISGAVSQQLADIGESLTEIFDSLIEKYQLGDVLSLTGHPTWKIIKWEVSSMYDLNEVKTLFLQEMFKNGVLVIGSHNVSLAIGKKEISIIQNAYEETFKVLAKAIKSNSVISYLEAKPLIPLFTVR
jgi:glutamate-1-semialdehyde 2,1-aminomutase